MSETEKTQDLGGLPNWYQEIFPAGPSDGFYLYRTNVEGYLAQKQRPDLIDIFRAAFKKRRQTAKKTARRLEVES